MEEIKQGNNKFYVGDDEEKPIAFITYRPSDGDQIIVDGTFVSDTLKGKGVGLQLIKKVVDFARQEDKKIIPVCPFVKKVMSRSDEYKDVLVIEQ